MREKEEQKYLLFKPNYLLLILAGTFERAALFPKPVVLNLSVMTPLGVE